MGNISNILGYQFVPSDLEVKILDRPEVQLENSMLEHGLTPPNEIILDGKLRRFASGTKGNGGHGDKTGWYIGFSDGIAAAKYGDWRSGIEVNFRADIGRKLTSFEEMANSKRMAEAKAIRDEELEKTHTAAANTVATIWDNATHASAEHGYLQRKGISSHGARVTGDGRLIVPLYDAEGLLSSIQYIGTNGEKKYHTGGVTHSCFWYLGTDSETIYVAEGFATAATIYEQTSSLTYIAYSASNIPNIVGILQDKYGKLQDICVIADNDESGVGQKYADQASAKYGCRVIIPPVKGDANDYKQAGNDLLALLQPKLDEWLIHADEFSNQPSAISWMVKGWLQDKALIMVHGPSGGGKTFVVLDWCLHIASDINVWFDNKVNNGSVIYLAGEGHHGLRGRVAAWKQHNQVNSLSMWLSKDGCDLNTPEGYHRVVSSLRMLNIQPKVIVVDTLHRFLQGDENSAQDAKTMLDACNALMNEFNCSVLLVHHTGVNDEAQHRARGSSAWRGALDIEISIVPSKDGNPIEIIQRKSKDAEISEPLFCHLESVPIKNWLDEDGEQVTSAVVVVAEKVNKPSRKDANLLKYIQRIQDAWVKYGYDLQDNLPNISRCSIAEYIEKQGFYTSKQSIKNALNANYEKGFINILVENNILKCNKYDDKIVSFSVIDDEIISQFMLLKSGNIGNMLP